MPEQRLAKARGECRCPAGVCLYRTFQPPDYCRHRAERLAAIADEDRSAFIARIRRAATSIYVAVPIEIAEELAGILNSCADRLLDTRVCSVPTCGQTILGEANRGFTCDGQHPSPLCADPACWQRSPS
jgi:hypothetical protein